MYSQHNLTLCLYFQTWYQFTEVEGEQAQLSSSKYPLSYLVSLKVFVIIGSPIQDIPMRTFW